MSDLLQKKDFLIWTKGPAALDAMKNSLYSFIKYIWVQHLETFTEDEKEHLEQFIMDMNKGCAVADPIRKEWKLTCEHRLCESLLKKLLEIRHNKKSLKIVWQTECNVTKGTISTGFSRVPIQDKCELFYWNIANMFMFYGGEKNEIENSSPADTDVALVLKMLKNCTLFEIDEIELYDQVIGIRNRIFHTGQYNMTENAMESMIDKLIELLKQIQKLRDCKPEYQTQIKDGIRELKEIMRRTVFTVSVDTNANWKPIAIRALQLQKEAITFDISCKGTLQYDTTALQGILKDTNLRIQEYTDSAEWREYMNDKRKREEEERRRQMNLAGLMSEDMADSLSGLGPVGRAAGAIVGGGVGSVAEGGKKLFSWIFER